MTLLREIEAYLERNNIKAATFGVHAINDKSLVLRLQRGTQVQAKTLNRVRKFMAKHPCGGSVPKASRKPYAKRVRKPIVEEIIPPRVYRVPCFRCGSNPEKFVCKCGEGR